MRALLLMLQIRLKQTRNATIRNFLKLCVASALMSLKSPQVEVVGAQCSTGGDISFTSHLILRATILGPARGNVRRQTSGKEAKTKNFTDN